MANDFNPGFLKLFYTLRDWEHFNNPNVLALWIHILLRARWQKKPGRHKGVELKRGQLVMGYEELGRECGLSFQQTRTAIEKLKATGEITTKSTNKGTVITVVNYTDYQDKFVEITTETTNKATSEQQANNNPATNEQQLNNNINNINNPYNTNNARAREAEKIPDDKVYMINGEAWTRAELREDARRRGLNMEMWETLKNPEWA